MPTDQHGSKRLGRPPLSDEQQRHIWAELSFVPKRSAAYRAARVRLAQELQRTERAIDIIFASLREKFLRSEDPAQEGAA